MAKNVEAISKKGTSDDLTEIRKDIESLRSHLSDLTKHAKQEGNEKLIDVKGMVNEALADYSKTGRKQYKEMENRVREKPAQSMAMAFGAGLLASFLMRR